MEKPLTNITKKYHFSFTGASALIAETRVVAEELEQLKDWKKVEKSLIENNLLQKVKQATFKREFAEIKKRLSLLTSNQLRLLTQGDSGDAKAIILLSLVKAYPYFNDFIAEVLLNKFLIFEKSVTESDYKRFFETKSLQYPEVLAISETTAKKVKQVIFKLLEQTGLITEVKNGLLVKPVLSSQVIKAIVEDNPSWLPAFLYSNDEIQRLTNG